MQDIALTHEEVAELRAYNVTMQKMKNQLKQMALSHLDRGGQRLRDGHSGNRRHNQQHHSPLHHKGRYHDKAAAFAKRAR